MEVQSIEGPRILEEGERASWWPPHLEGKLLVETKRLNGVACDPSNPEHMKCLEKWFADKVLGQWMDGADDDEIQTAEYLKGSFEDDYADPEKQIGDIYVFFTEKSTGKPVGFGALYDMDPETGSVEASVMIGEMEFHGFGLGNEIGRAVVAVAFKYMHAFSIKALIVKTNPASYRIAKRVGFQDCGVLCRSHRYKGRLYDQYILQAFPECIENDEGYADVKVYPKEEEN